MPTFDPDLARLLDMIRQAARPAFEALTPEDARQAYAASWDILQPPAQEVASLSNVTIDTDAGPLALRIYRGAGAPAPPATAPCPRGGKPARPPARGLRSAARGRVW